jgi:hypothetical protein
MEAFVHIGEKKLLPGECYLNESKCYDYNSVVLYRPEKIAQKISEKCEAALTLSVSGLKRRTFVYLWPEDKEEDMDVEGDQEKENEGTYIWVNVKDKMVKVRSVPL